jgi:hypothetical protein
LILITNRFEQFGLENSSPENFEKVFVILGFAFEYPLVIEEHVIDIVVIF